MSREPVGAVAVEIPDGAGPIAIVRIDFSPLNIGSLVMRRALYDALEALRERRDLAGAILIGSGPNFVAGSDIEEFDAPPQAPHLPQIIELIEQLPFPVVAAIAGAALGGGCELAMGCDWRVASADAVMGLPEATLGLIPGAGGTVRLPRLVGPARALELATSGKRLGARQALADGLIDQIAAGDLQDAALAWLGGHIHKRRTIYLVLPKFDADALRKSAQIIKDKARGSDAIVATADAVLRATDLDPATALGLERDVSLALRGSAQSKALRYLFKAERRAGRSERGAVTLDISRVGVVGAGRMGSDIAYIFARAGIAVRLVEDNPAVVTRAMARLTEGAERLVQRGELASVRDLTDCVELVPLRQLADCQLVVEAIPEDMGLKKSLLAALGNIVGPQTILATNTSYLDINAMAEAVPGGQRLVGMHFFNPAAVLKLVEIVRGADTSDLVVASTLKLARRLDKLPILTRVGEGFVGNRIYAAYRRQCEYLLEDGCLPEQIDRAMKQFGMAMGPFAVFDLAGLEVAWAMRKRLAATRSNAERYVEIPDLLCELERFGKLLGKGWYDYAGGKAVPSPEVNRLIVEASRQKGIVRRSFTDGEIVAALLAAMANEAGWVVAEGVCAQPEDIDVAMCNGFGFPRHAGGVLYWASRNDPDGRAAHHAATSSGRPPAPNLAELLASISLNPGQA